MKKQIFIVLSIALFLQAYGQTNPTPQSLPYTQNFNSFDGAQTSYPAGIQGWTVAGSLSTTVSTAAPSGDAPLSGGSNATTTAGVYDMVGKIGVLSTGSNIRAICLSINTLSKSNISVTYTVRTQRNENTRVNELLLQYRIGESGTFTTVAGSGYQNQLLPTNTTGTDGINPQTINVTLPTECENQSIVQLRWICRDVSGSGNRPSFSVDDISISGASAGSPTKLAITSINGGISPTVNAPFSVTVQSQDNSNSPANVTQNTNIVLSKATGTGTLSGTLTGTINAGTSSTTITGVLYDVTETGVSITATRTSGDVLSPGTSATFTVLEAATKLAFVNVPTTSQKGRLLASFNVEARRSDDTKDLAYTGSITITKLSGPGSISGTLTKAAVAGSATFDDIQFDQVGTYVLFASATNLTGATSGDIYIIDLTEVILPQFIQGIPSGSSNTARIPFAYRVSITGLLPNSTYRYFNQVVTSADGATANGAGNCIFANVPGAFVRTSGPSMATAGNYGEFTTDGSGNYTGWFVTEPTGNARFLAGTNLYMRIMLNDGAGGTTVATRLTTSSSVLVKNFGTTNTEATGIRGYSNASPSNFVALYDNEAGSGRPIACTFVESDGTANTTGNSYVAFYSDSVNGFDGRWGTIIPNDLPNGIRRIEQRSFTNGNILNFATDADGIWPSGANTVNPSSGTTPIVILESDAPLTGTTPTKLAITSVNGGASPTKNVPFYIVVQSQDNSGSPANVSNNTQISLSLATGTGTLGGNLIGTILAGTNTVNISGITYNVAESGVSITATRTSGDFLSPGTSTTFTVLEAATKLVFTTVPAGGQANAILPSIIVEARRPDDSRDNSFIGNITISKLTGPGTISGTLTVAAAAGIATFNDITFNQMGIYTISASSAGLTDATSGNIRIASLSDVILPQYIEGLRPTNTNRIPHAYWLKINGLLPNATYRYINHVVIATDGAGINGAGNPIYVSRTGDFVRTTNTSLGTPGRYGTFTTDENGSYAGWFITEPTGNATRFVPGINIFMRVTLNNGTEDPADTLPVIRLTTFESSKVLTLSPASSDTTGTGLRCTSLAPAKDFVLLYDNIAGTGRPISGSFIESDGTANTIANSYAAFYANHVDGVNGAFGVVIPNQLPNGIRRIERRSLIDCSILAVATDDDGIWPSSANTVNPSGGTSEIVLTTSDVPIGVTSNLYSFKNGWNMISLPLIVNDPRKHILFPTATSNAFLYIPGIGYAAKDTIYRGIGYWLKFNGDQTLPLEGIPVLSDSIDVVAGWNLIGCIADTVLVSNINSVPPNIISSNFYGYNMGYVTVTELYPAKSYWVKVNQNGKLYLNSSKK